MQQFIYPFCEEYSQSIEFKTSIISRFDGSEQRQALWMCPKRSFRLNFELNAESKLALEDFFKQQKGDYAKFFWRWDESYFGNNLDYVCFFDSLKLSQSVLPYSYSKLPLALSSIDDGNILKGRFLLDNKFWSFQGNVVITPSQAAYQGESRLFQSGVLTSGNMYRLKVKTHNIQGLPPYLSNETAVLDELGRNFFGGDKTIDFIALGPDLVFEMPSNSSGQFCEIALFDLSNNQSIFDFQPNVEYQNDIIFANLNDEIFTFQNSRQNLFENPIRRWVFSFELTPYDAKRFEAFFISKRGRYKAFTWNFEGENILVRFDTDKLDQKHYQLGYREVKIPIIEVLQ